MVLGADRLWEKVCPACAADVAAGRRILGQADGDEEIRWQRRTGRQDVQKGIDALAQGEEDQRIQIWMRVRLGGQRLTEVARAFGFRNGSGVHRVVQRLEARATHDRQLAKYLRRMEEGLNVSVSRVDPWPWRSRPSSPRGATEGSSVTLI